jgi:tetratricopeptide (TPR) repeat protein
MTRAPKTSDAIVDRASAFRKEAREWCAVIFGLIGMVLGICSYNLSEANRVLALQVQKTAKETEEKNRKAEVEKLIDEAWDLMGGKIGTYVIFDVTKDRASMELARRKLEEALTRDRDNARAYRVKGVYLEALGGYAKALEAYNTSLRLDPNASTFIDMSVALAKSGKDELAIQALRSAEKIGTHNGVVYLSLAAIYRKKGMIGESRRTLAVAQELLKESQEDLPSGIDIINISSVRYSPRMPRMEEHGPREERENAHSDSRTTP